MAFTFNHYVSEFTGTDNADRAVFHQGAGNVATGNGNDSVDFFNWVNDVDTGAGNDLVVFHGHAGAGTVDLGEGNNTMFVDGGRINSIEGGEGTDFISGNGSIGSADLGNGDNQIIVDGHVNTIRTGSGVDNIDIDGTDFASLGAGDDIFRASGYARHVEGGEGDDRFETSGGGNLYGGEGDDTFVFDFDPAAATTHVDGGAGKDKVVIEIDSLDAMNFDQMSSDLADYAKTGEAFLTQFNLSLKDVDVIEVQVGGSPIETFDYGDLFA